MNKIASIIIVIFMSLATYCQDSTELNLSSLIASKRYDEIIQQYSNKYSDLSAQSLYYIGMAYYMKEDDSNCIRFMNLSIDKDAKNPAPYFIKASTMNYMGKFDDAIKYFKAAIDLKPDDPQFYSGLGDSYYNLKKDDEAVGAYKKAIEQKDCPDRPYSMIAQIYSEQKNNDKALEAYYLAKSRISKQSDSYLNTLFNIGVIEMSKGNYDKAEPSFTELIALAPTDYHSYAKLIQIFYHRREYEKAKPLKEKLYQAYKKGELKGNMADMFCFDQFKWNDKSVQVYERFEEGQSKKIYNKHIFYIINADDKIDLTIQTEYSPISAEMGGAKYLVCMSKGDMHGTFNAGFNDDFNYDDLKKIVIDILDEKIKPAVSSAPTR